MTPSSLIAVRAFGAPSPGSPTGRSQASGRISVPRVGAFRARRSRSETFRHRIDLKTALPLFPADCRGAQSSSPHRDTDRGANNTPAQALAAQGFESGSPTRCSATIRRLQRRSHGTGQVTSRCAFRRCCVGNRQTKSVQWCSRSGTSSPPIRNRSSSAKSGRITVKDLFVAIEPSLDRSWECRRALLRGRAIR